MADFPWMYALVGLALALAVGATALLRFDQWLERNQLGRFRPWSEQIKEYGATPTNTPV